MFIELLNEVEALKAKVCKPFSTQRIEGFHATLKCSNPMKAVLKTQDLFQSIQRLVFHDEGLQIKARKKLTKLLETKKEWSDEIEKHLNEEQTKANGLTYQRIHETAWAVGSFRSESRLYCSS